MPTSCMPTFIDCWIVCYILHVLKRSRETGCFRASPPTLVTRSTPQYIYILIWGFSSDFPPFHCRGNQRALPTLISWSTVSALG